MKKTIIKNVIHPLLAIAISVSFVWAQNRGFTIQIASPTSEAEARSIVADLQAKGIEAYWVKAEVPGKGTRYRVRIGRFDKQAEAKAVADRHLSRGAIKEFIITLYDAPAPESVARRESKAKNTAPPSADQIKNEQPAGEKAASEESPNKRPRRSEPAPAEKAPVETAASKPVTEPAKEKASHAAPDKPEPAKVSAEKSTPASAEKTPSATTDKPEPARTGAEKPTLAAVAPTAEPKPETNAEAVKPSTEKDPAEKTATDTAKTEKARKPAAIPSALEPELGGSTARKVSNADPAIATPPVAEALADMTINNDNWKVIRRSVETDKNLRAIYFVDSMTGWAAGDAGAVYRTTDGGKTWKPLLAGAAANINFIYFIDWNHGWMLGEGSGRVATDENDNETVLLLTTNGGRTWTRKPAPNVLSLYFTDTKNGWAVGRNATLMKTTDGGLEWTKVESIEKLIGLPVESSNYNFGFRDIYFIDAHRGWLIGNFYGRARSNIGGIFATSDGGANWKRVPVTFQTQYTSGRFTPGLLHSVRFTDSDTGSVTGEMYDGEGRFFFALHTRDGGKIWEQFRTPSRATHSTQFLDRANGWTAAFAPREGGAEAVVYDTTLMRTDNGGMSWRNDFIARGRRIRGVFFLSPTKGWAVGDRGMILRYEEKSKAN
ncbi:MAG: YCF48-related protein [Acidobacteria bacterium]|nr:YCF48-related protein [Acidobacteriota bacterium]